MKRKAIVFSLLGIMFLTGCNKVKKEVLLPLPEKDIEEAVEYGIKNASLSTTEFVKGWTVDLGYGEGKGSATLITPFLKTALLSKQAHNQGQKVKREIIERVLRENSDCLIFEFLLFGGYPQFGRSVEFSLKVEDKEIKPVYQFVPPYAEMGRDYTQAVKGKVHFQRTEVPENSKVVLKAQFNVSDEPDIKDKYICEFEFDLQKYK